MTESKLVVGPWLRDGSTRSRTLRYGGHPHPYEVTGQESQNSEGYHAMVYVRPCGAIQKGPFKFSYQAQAWFLEQARKQVSA